MMIRLHFLLLAIPAAALHQAGYAMTALSWGATFIRMITETDRLFSLILKETSPGRWLFGHSRVS